MRGAKAVGVRQLHAGRVDAILVAQTDDHLRLERVHLEVKRDNARAIRAYVKAGFQEVARPAGAADSVAMERRFR